METAILNVCEVFAKDRQSAIDAHAGWIARSETLDIMYDNIAGLHNAELETKNFIYDKLMQIVYPMILKTVKED